VSADATAASPFHARARHLLDIGIVRTVAFLVAGLGLTRRRDRVHRVRASSR
jgi:hypothetical protein